LPSASGRKKKAARFLGPLFSNLAKDLVPAATTIAAATATTIATVSAATTTAAAAVSTTAAATTTTAFTGFHRTCFVHGQGPAVDFLAMEFRDGRLGFVRRSHFDKAETTGTSCHSIIDHLHPRDIAGLGKEIGQVVFRHAEGQIAHIEFNAH
jgi:hypothetical protein